MRDVILSYVPVADKPAGAFSYLQKRSFEFSVFGRGAADDNTGVIVGSIRTKTAAVLVCPHPKETTAITVPPGKQYLHIIHRGELALIQPHEWEEERTKACDARFFLWRLFAVIGFRVRRIEPPKIYAK